MFVCTSLFLFMCVCANRDLKWLKQASTKNFQHCLDDVRYKSVSHSEVCFLSLSSNSPSLQICIAEIYMEKKKLHTQLHPPPPPNYLQFPRACYHLLYVPNYLCVWFGFSFITFSIISASSDVVPLSRKKKVLLLVYKCAAFGMQLSVKLCFLHLAARQIRPYCDYSSNRHSWRRSFTGKNKPWWQLDVYMSAVNNLHEKRV